MQTTAIETVSSVEACYLADVSYRQIDYWTRLGLVEPTRPATGSGSRRRWTLADVLVLRVVHRLMVLRVPHAMIREAIALLESEPALLWVRSSEVSAGDAFDFLSDVAASMSGETTILVISPEAMRAEVLDRHNRG